MNEGNTVSKSIEKWSKEKVKAKSESWLESLIDWLKATFGVVVVAGSIIFIYGGVTVAMFATGCWTAKNGWGHILFWTLFPPVWFAAEYSFKSYKQSGPAEAVRANQVVASKIWAAILAAILFLAETNTPASSSPDRVPEAAVSSGQKTPSAALKHRGANP